ncbi:MAG TPA: phytase [Pirellulales bacterium]|jgi:myo-inositol-hexaphosphate 3-phosphohydrolase
MRNVIACGLLVLAGCSEPATTNIAEPLPLRASQPVPVNRVRSAAIWVNPLDAAQSRIMIANAARGIEVHDLNGLLLKHLDEGYETNSVTILHGFPLAGKPVDLLLATYPDQRVAGVKLWMIHAEKAKLKEVPGADRFTIPDNPYPRGIAAYRSRQTGKSYIFVTTEEGYIDQVELTSDAQGAITVRQVRRLELSGKTEGCVADEDRGVVYFAEEKRGVWRFGAEPDVDSQGQEVIKVGEHGLVPDVEGICLYCLGPMQGYLVVVGQGAKSERSRLNVYDRQDLHFVGAIVPSAAGGNAVEFASGVAVTSAPLPDFPQGLLLVKDRNNPNASEDFKYFSWADCAKALQLSTTASAAEQSAN